MWIYAIRGWRVWRRDGILSRPDIACGKHCPICRQDPCPRDSSIYTIPIASDVIREMRTSKQIARCQQRTNCGEVDQSVLTRETANCTATWQARPLRKSRGQSARVARQRMPSPHGSALSSHHARRPPSIAPLYFTLSFAPAWLNTLCLFLRHSHAPPHQSMRRSPFMGARYPRS